MKHDGDRLAVDGGTPVRSQMLPYARQSVSSEDAEAVLEALRSGWLTTGPRVEEFEQAFAAVVGGDHAVAVANGTAALHAAMHAAGVGPGDEVLVPAITFVASANAALFTGARPVFVDVEPDTLLIDVADLERHITPRTRVIVAVDYGGQPCDYDALQALAQRHELSVVADACHALGGSYRGRPVGSLADLSTFSFHPVKQITTAEGGMVVTADRRSAERMRRFRNHGITSDHHQRAAQGSWHYEMAELGYNYRLSDIQCALGTRQLARLDEWVARRRQIARRYDEAFAELPGVEPLAVRSWVEHAYHLYVIRVGHHRQSMFTALRAEGIGVNVHYTPVHLHPFYRERLGTGPGLCPRAESAFEGILSLPMFPAMTDTDVEDVITAVRKVGTALLS